MIFDITYFDTQTKITVNKTLGKSFSFFERIRLNGIGSSRMIISSVSPKIAEYLGDNSNLDYANIELRPKGVIVHFRYKMREYIWLIPYHQLQIFQTKTWSVHAQGEFIKFRPDSVLPKNKKFIRKLLSLKADFLKDHQLPT